MEPRGAASLPVWAGKLSPTVTILEQDKLDDLPAVNIKGKDTIVGNFEATQPIPSARDIVKATGFVMSGRLSRSHLRPAVRGCGGGISH